MRKRLCKLSVILSLALLYFIPFAKKLIKDSRKSGNFKLPVRLLLTLQFYLCFAPLNMSDLC